jgi:mono/diheme cytochrome c family protein
VSATPRPRSRFLPGVLVGLVIAAVFGAVFLAPLLLTHHNSLPLEEAFGAMVVNGTTQALSASVGANPNASDDRAVRSGRDAYIGSCSQCHGPSGNSRGLFGSVTYPAATDLTSPAAKALSDAQLFYIVKNGLGFTAMPAYASQYADRELWGLVSYIRALQTGTAPTVAVTASGASQTGNASRGADIYVAQGCATCHGVAPGQARVERSADDMQQAIRRGRPGMPKYTPEVLSDADLADLTALVTTLPAVGAQPQGRGER